MHSISIAFEDLAELQEGVSRHSLIDDKKSLIQLFVAKADRAYIQELQTFFQKHFPLASCIGSTTDGVVEGRELYNDTKSVAVFSFFEHTQPRSAFHTTTQECDSFCCGEQLALDLVEEDTKVLIAFGDGLHLNGEEFVNGVASVSSDVILSGGLAGDNGVMQATYVFDKEHLIERGAVGVALNSKRLHATTKYSFDWTPLGKKLQVTRAIKNRVYEIDGMSAVAVYAKYLGYEVANELPQLGVEFPLIFEKDGVLVGRAVLNKHNDGSLSFAGNIPQGSYVQFGLGNVERILQSVHYSIEHLTEALPYRAETIFLYSCMARRRFLKEEAKSELAVLSELGPVFGFYTYGEFFHNQQSNQLLNETMTLLSLSESEDIVKHRTHTDIVETRHTLKTEHALANLANAVSRELEELNDNLEEKVKESAAFIYKQAYFDKLTQLPNRLSLLKNIEKNIGKTILLVNIDDFTTINDFYGYAIGDKLLVYVANLLVEKFKEKDAQVYKLPSDEFAITVDFACKREKVEASIKRILELLERKKFFIDNDESIEFTVTVAAANINNTATALANVDMILKLAKQKREAYMIYEEDMMLSKHYEHNLTMAKMIKNAIKEDKIVPYFQPIYDIKTLKIEKYEALVRLQKEDGSVLSPFAFLEIAQKIRVYPKITQIMIEKVFSIMREKCVACTLNLDFEDIYNLQTKQMLFDAIERYNVAGQLTIEILENQEIADQENFNNFIQEIRNRGVAIAIDDFGSGYANFEHIAKIHSDFIKIDGSLIKNIDKDSNARLIVETIVIFANKLNQKTVAEFVHSKEVYEIVKEIGVDFVQGYYFAEPKAEIIEENNI